MKQPASEWSTNPDIETVAKLFIDMKDAFTELTNLDRLNKLLFAGVTAGDKSQRHLWALMEKEKGCHLKDLPSRSLQNAIKEGLDACGDYMEMIRTAIRDAHEPYLKMPGAPEHGFVY